MIVDGAKLVRTGQTLFPGLADAKYSAQRRYRRTFRRPCEADFGALKTLGLDPEGLFVDGGANRGQSIEAIRLTYPNAAIVAFEPNPKRIVPLAAEYADDRTQIVGMGLGAEPGFVELHIPSYRGYVFDGLASVDRAEAADWLPKNIYKFREERLRIESVHCQIVTLDSFKLDPVFIKLDIQGAELDALLGARSTLTAHHPVLLIEAPQKPVVEFLGDFGYKPHAWTKEKQLRQGLFKTLNTFFL